MGRKRKVYLLYDSRCADAPTKQKQKPHLSYSICREHTICVNDMPVDKLVY